MIKFNKHKHINQTTIRAFLLPLSLLISIGYAVRSYAQSEANGATIGEILEAVSIERITETMHHLTGVSTYTINGKEDSIMTRHSNSFEMPKSEAYLENQFEALGYTVERFPFQSKVAFMDVEFAPDNQSVGWIAGNDGRLYATDDGGQSWEMQFAKSERAGRKIFPLTSEVVWMVGLYGTIIKTEDGRTWREVSAPTAEHLLSVYFVDAQIGWACGSNGSILNSTDGGDSWQIQSSPVATSLTDIAFANASEGWAVGDDGHILHTTDGGTNWILQHGGEGPDLLGLHVVTDKRTIAVGRSESIMLTENGGTDWTLKRFSESKVPIVDIDFSDESNGRLITMEGFLMTTTDGGLTWNEDGRVGEFPTYGFDLPGGTDIWSSGHGIVAQSNDDGGSWGPKHQDVPVNQLNNLYVTKTGTQYPGQYYTLCAHYDSFSWTSSSSRAPGADDNASGTAAVLEAARVLAQYDFPYSIRFMLFSGEEQGLVGSRAYAKAIAARGDDIRGVINLDMIGFDGNGDGANEIHMGTRPASAEIGDAMKHVLYSWELDLQPEFFTEESTGASDHRAYWDEGYPAVLLIEDKSDDFNPYYHSIDDRMEYINFAFLLENARLAIVSVALLASDANVVLSIDQEDVVFPVTELQIEGVYPNPFSEVFNMVYTLKSPMQISVSLIDLQGVMVKQLMSTYQYPGQYSMSWDASDLSTGLYQLHIKAGEHIETKKLVHYH